MILYPAIDLKDGACVRLLRGERGRRKWVAVEGLTAAELRRRLLALSGS